MHFKYDTFISYSHKDREWAEKLEDSLRKKLLRTFFDSASLRAGDIWEKKLLQELLQSRSLIVLWSKHAKDSDWVNRERFRFDVLISEAGSTRRLIIVALDDTDDAFKSFQTIRLIQEAGAYAAGADTVDGNVWSNVITMISEAIQADAGSTPINLVVMATTDQVFSKIDPRAKPTFAPSLEKMLSDFRIPKTTDLQKNYKPTREEWHPFLGNESIGTLLSQLLDQINQLAAPYDRSFRWRSIGDGFWSDDLREFKLEAGSLSAGPSLVIVDLVSLYDVAIAVRLKEIEAALERNDQATVMVLAPCPIDEVSTVMRSVIEALAGRIFSHVYESVDPGRYFQASFGIRILDLIDMKRVLLPALRRMLRTETGDETHSVLSMGGS